MRKDNASSQHALSKSPTGITGLDEVLQGGLPAGRTTLVYGGPGCGKTVLAMHFIVNGAKEYNEPGLFVSFEESPGQLTENFRSFGFNLDKMIEDKMLAISHMDISSEEIVEAGQFTLDALLIRLENSLARIGARRLVLDAMENLFSAFSSEETLRQEIARLLKQLKAKGVTTILTGERAAEGMTRHGFEDYVTDCVLLLDHRIAGQVSKRRMRVIKYRGSAHSSDEFPFIISDKGVLALPITSVGLEYAITNDRLTTGVADLDAMLENKGYYRGSSILVSGKAGTGKSSLSAAFAAATCGNGERCLYLAFEESSDQLVRNMQSIGIDLAGSIERELLFIRAYRPTLHGIEEHLVSIFSLVNTINPACIVLDPISNFISIGSSDEIKSMLTRLLHYIKCHGITVFMTNLTAGSGHPNETDTNVSSLVDTWLALDQKKTGNTRHRELYIIKSRGMNHSHETSELIMSAKGLSLQSLSGSRSKKGKPNNSKDIS